LVPDPVKFPRGIKALADDIHALGLKIGIYRQIVFAVLIWHSNREYSDAGTKTCGGHPGSLGYEATDAATWGSWDIDCELYDYCNTRYVLLKLTPHRPDLKYGKSFTRLIVRHISTMSHVTDNCYVPASWNDTSVSSKFFPASQNKDNVLAVS
jgi:hypothetical protein